MTPDLDDLVGADLEPAVRKRLERVHELLLSVGPPPEAAPAAPVELRPRRRRGVLLALAAALAVAAFALGAALTDDSAGRSVDFTVALKGTSAVPGARGSLVVFDVDAAGNWPMELTVEGLPLAEGGRPFELWLTRGGKPEALCGGFLTNEEGAAVVPLNEPYKFDEFDGWVVVEEGTTTPLLTTT